MLELYQAEGCPYSEAVREKLTDLGASYVLHNPRRPGEAGGAVLNEQVRDEMVAIGGEDQIPFLVDHGAEETRYGAEEIRSYLEDRYG